MCCKHTSFSGFLSQRCRSDFGSPKNELATGSDVRIHTTFITEGWNTAAAFHQRAFAALWPRSHPPCHRTTSLLRRKPNWWVESTIKPFHLLTRCHLLLFHISLQSPLHTWTTCLLSICTSLLN